MKTVILMLTATVAATAVMAQMAVPPPGSGPQPQMVRRPMGPPPTRTGERADLAVEFVSGMPTVLATVDGKGPFRLGIETGYPGYLRLRPDAAARAGLAPIGEALASDPSGKNPQRVPIYGPTELRLGELTFSGVNAGSTPLASERMKALDGIIGLGFFRDLLLTVDYAKARMTLAPGALAAGPDVLPIERVQGLISFPLTIGDKTWPVHLDTGNSRHPLFMPTAAIAELPTTGAPFPIGQARTISQEVTLSAMKLAAPVRAGPTVLAVSEVAYPAIAEVGNLGSLGLVGQVLTLDLANNRMRLAPSR